MWKDEEIADVITAKALAFIEKSKNKPFFLYFATQDAHVPAGEFRGGKYSSFEGGTRVPGILSWQGTVKPGVSDRLLCQIDMFASFAEMLKVKLPSGAAHDSQNYLNAWLNKGGTGREYLVLQNINNNLSIEDGTWKFIAPGKGPAINLQTNTELGNLNQDQLYNLSVDRGEKVNVALKNSQIVDRLRSELSRVKAVILN